MIRITVNDELKEIEEGQSLLSVIARFTPYGEESTICVHNGISHKSIDVDIQDIIVSDGDKISIYPLIIGG